MDNWQLLATIDALTKRAEMYQKIRRFFSNKSILEVETPLLSEASTTDPNINSFEVLNKINNKKLYLQTSPEFAMKRLLCSKINKSIYQICKAFRSEELGRYHHVEFTILEWYRLNFDMDKLILEIIELLCLLLNINNNHYNIIKYSYRSLFLEYLNFDYNLITIDDLLNIIKKLYKHNFDNIIYNENFDKLYNKDDLLMILLSHYIEPRFPQNKIIIIYNYPSTQAALAKIENNIAKRFEVYYNGVELANGFEELSDAKEQLNRFELDNIKRENLNLDKINIDYKLIQALENGLPNCSGVAMGLDRLLMLLLGVDKIDDVISFRF